MIMGESDRERRKTRREIRRKKLKQNEKHEQMFKDKVNLFIEQQNQIMEKLKIVQTNQVIIREVITGVLFGANSQTARDILKEIGDVIGPETTSTEGEKDNELAKLPGLEQAKRTDQKAEDG